MTDLKDNGINPASELPLSFEVRSHIATITLNRPQHGNALSPALLIALEQAWQRVEDERDIRAAIITGAGDRHFCTGADVGSLQVGMGGLRYEPYADANRFSPRMMHVSKPVICAVNGLVNGGGLHFVADSDIVIATSTAVFMDSHVTVGQVSALESQGVARRAGVGAALLMALAGRSYRMPVERALALGIVDLVEAGPVEVMAKAREIAGMICENSPQAVALTKRAIWASIEMNDPASAEYGWELLKSHWTHPDFEEGVKAFGERRKPVWNPDPGASQSAT